MKKVIAALITVVLLGCILWVFVSSDASSVDPTYAKVLTGQKLDLMEGEIKPNPDMRNLRVISTLDATTADAIIQYLKTGKTRRYGYVASKFYLRCADCTTSGDIIYGFVLDESGLLGINVTGFDSSRIPITTTHKIIVNDSPDLEAVILDAINADDNSRGN